MFMITDMLSICEYGMSVSRPRDVPLAATLRAAALLIAVSPPFTISPISNSSLMRLLSLLFFWPLLRGTAAISAMNGCTSAERIFTLLGRLPPSPCRDDTNPLVPCPR